MIARMFVLTAAWLIASANVGLAQSSIHGRIEQKLKELVDENRLLVQ